MREFHSTLCFPTHSDAFIVIPQRPRPPGQYISQQEWELGAQAEEDFILGRRYDVLQKFCNQEYLLDHGFVTKMEGRGTYVAEIHIEWCC